MSISPAVVRVFLHYLSMYLVLKGFAPQEMADALSVDPMIIEGVTIGLGVAISGATWFWYWLAKKLGWRT